MNRSLDEQSAIVEELWQLVETVRNSIRTTSSDDVADGDVLALTDAIAAMIESFSLRPSAAQPPAVTFVRVESLEVLLDSLLELSSSQVGARDDPIQLVASRARDVLDVLVRALSPNDDRYLALRSSAARILEEIDRIIENAGRRRLGILISRVDNAVAHAEQAAGVVAETTLGTHYNEYSDRQEKSANRLRAVSSTLLVVVFLSALGVIYFGDSASVWPMELARLSISIPLLLLAYYLSRESSRHRNISLRAREIEMRLQTIKAFTEGLPDVERNEIRGTLGRVVFGGAIEFGGWARECGRTGGG